MGDKLNLTTVSSGYQDTAALNANFEAVETAIDNTLSRDGSTPNQMSADLDMNGYSVINATATGSTSVNFTHRGNWASGTDYVQNNITFVTVASDATNGGASYVCTTDHTSTSFATDLAANWQLLASRGVSGAGTGDMLAANDLSDVDSVSTARTNLGLGTAATYDAGISAANEILTTDNQYTEADLTISGGAVTPTVSKNTLAPQSGTSDTLDTINTTSVIDGASVQLRVNNSLHTITISHGTGNIYLKDGRDFIIAANNQKTILLERRGSDWFEVSRSAYSTLELVSSTTLSTDTNWESPTLSSAYREYVIKLDNVYSSVNQDTMNLTFSNDDGSTYESTSYRWIYTRGIGAGNVASFTSTSDSDIEVATQVCDSSGESITGEIKLSGHSTPSGYAKVTTNVHGWDAVGGNMYSFMGHGFRNNAEETNKIKLAFSSGTMTGTISIYGLTA